VEGRSGSGKSYIFGVVELVEQFLPYERGRLITNVDLLPDKIGAFCSQFKTEWAEDAADRIRIIPRADTQSWRTNIDEGGSGPWDYFAGQDIEGVHLVIDEAHSFAGAKHSAQHRRKWAEFLGEVRHRGGTVQLLTQSRKKLAEELVHEAGQLYTVVGLDNRAEFVTGCNLGDLLQLKARFTRRYAGGAFVQSWIPGARGWQVDGKRTYLFEHELFALYNTTSATQDGEAGAKRPPRLEWEVLNARQFALWFMGRNLMPLALRGSVCSVAFWLTAMGGGGWLMGKFLDIGAGPSVRAIKESSLAQAAAKPKGGVTGKRLLPVDVVSDEPRPNDLPGPEIGGINGQAGASDRVRRETMPANLAKYRAERSEVVKVEDWGRVVGVTTQGVLLEGGVHVQVGERLLPGDDGVLDRVDPVLGRYWLLCDFGTPGRRPGTSVAVAGIAGRLAEAADDAIKLRERARAQAFAPLGESSGRVAGNGTAGPQAGSGPSAARSGSDADDLGPAGNGSRARSGQGGGDKRQPDGESLDYRGAAAGGPGRAGAANLSPE
jgi:hypothetical protein